MEKLNLEKFTPLSNEEMNKIEGGYKWHVECYRASNGATWHCAYRYRSDGSRVWGTAVTD